MLNEEQKERIKTQIKTMMLNSRFKLENGKMTNFLDEFNDPLTVEVLCNADGTFWVEKLGQGLKKIGLISPTTVGNIINQVSSFYEYECNKFNAICEAEFPVDNSRFEGLIPPLVSAPSFSLRKKATKIFTLDDYVKQGIMTPRQREIISDATVAHKNMLIVGGTGSGKTTLINAVIYEMVERCPDDRVIIIEDTGEIQCSAFNKLQLHTTEKQGMTALLRATLRLRPDRILVGEVRGPEALDLLDAWNTGHSGGLATLHSNTALSGLDRLKSLINRNSACPKNENDVNKIIGETVNYVVNIARDKKGRSIKGIIKVNYYDPLTKSFNYENVV